MISYNYELWAFWGHRIIPILSLLTGRLETCSDRMNRERFRHEILRLLSSVSKGLSTQATALRWNRWLWLILCRLRYWLERGPVMMFWKFVINIERPAWASVCLMLKPISLIDFVSKVKRTMWRSDFLVLMLDSSDWFCDQYQEDCVSKRLPYADNRYVWLLLSSKSEELREQATFSRW